jgi:hypothetical protein
MIISESLRTATQFYSFRFAHELFLNKTVAKRFNTHLDRVVTLCPHRAKKRFSSEYRSHLALQHYRGGCPVPRVASLSQRRLVSHTLTYNTNVLSRDSVFLAF